MTPTRFGARPWSGPFCCLKCFSVLRFVFLASFGFLLQYLYFSVRFLFLVYFYAGFYNFIQFQHISCICLWFSAFFPNYLQWFPQKKKAARSLRATFCLAWAWLPCTSGYLQGQRFVLQFALFEKITEYACWKYWRKKGVKNCCIYQKLFR